MSRSSPVRRILMLFALALLGGVSAVAADSPNAAADRVLDRWVDASGGVRKLKAVKCSEYRIRFTGANGFAWEMQMQMSADAKWSGTAQMPNGEIKTGCDGKVAWILHSALGGRLLPPDELARERNESGPMEPIRSREGYPRRRVAADETIDGKALHVVELTDEKGFLEKWYFDPTSGQRVRRVVNDPKRARVTTYSDFRKIDGITQPFRTESMLSGGTLGTELLAVSHKAKPTGLPWAPPPGFVEGAQQAEAALERFRTVLGGPTAMEKIKTRIARGHTTIKTNGITMQSTISQKGPNLLLIEQEMPGVGRSLQGYDGKTAWSWSELQGYRELRGPELGQIIGNADIRSAHRLGEDTPFRKWLGERSDASGRKLVAIDLATAQGSAGVHYFDVATGLLVKVETMIAAGPGGSMKVTVEMSDYRPVGSEQIAFVTTITNPAFQAVTTLEQVEHNVELADEIFAPRKTGELPAKASAPAEPTAPVAAPPVVPTTPAAPGK